MYASLSCVGRLYILFPMIKGTRLVWHVACVGGKREVCTGFWSGNVKERGRFQDLGVDGRSVLKWVVKQSDGRLWTELNWLKVGTSGECLWTR